jgi:protein ImuA
MAIETSQPQRTVLLASLRDEIRRLERRPDRRAGVLPCGLAGVDEALPAGGFPRGSLSELRGGPASGKTAVALALVAALGREELGAGELYPPAAAALGVDLGRFLLVRPARDAQAPGERAGDAQARAEVGRTTSEQRNRTDPYGEQHSDEISSVRRSRDATWGPLGGEAAVGGRQAPREEARPRPRVDLFWAAEALLESGAFGAVIVDVALPPGLRGVDGLLRRLQTAAERGGTIGLWLSAPGSAMRAPSGIRLDIAWCEGRVVARREGRSALRRAGDAA